MIGDRTTAWGALIEESGSHMTPRWREMDSVLRRSQTTQKTQRFRHSRCGDKKGFVPGFVPDSRLPRIEIRGLKAHEHTTSP